MRKSSVLFAIITILCVALSAEAMEVRSTVPYQVVVDGRTRVKVLNDYALLTRDAIQRVWRTPIDINVPGALKGRVRVDYVVKRSGELESVKLIKGSGRSEMDQSLIKAIRAAQPFPPFPDGVTASRILVRANFIVADLPTARVTTVSQPVSARAKSEAARKAAKAKKLLWGRAAGTATDTTAKATVKPPRPPIKKFVWGAPR